MPLAVGDKLGPYEILGPLGAGGMGAVYRARDTRLGRDVAIKISSAQFTDRFEREGRAVAALNHPNICHLYDVGALPSGAGYLVMELIEGQTLTERIRQGPIPLEEALRIAAQIRDALEAAHDKLITHRDLKPGNVMLTSGGSSNDVVKVLDFGLAKQGRVAAASSTDPPHSSTLSPTLSIAATEAGLILGTAAYMAPEQAKGRPVDKRADIWAFGVVLYEMLTGERPFHGEDVGDIMASVIKEQPKFEKLPAKVRPLIESCLEKDPKNRLRDIGDAWKLLDAGSQLASLQSRDREGASTAPSPSRLGKIAIAAAAVFALVAIALSFVHFRDTPLVHQSLRLQMTLPGNLPTRDVALSPDGRYLAFVVGAAGPGQLWVRAMDSTKPTALTGAEAVTYVFWSPDSANLGFFSLGKLKRIALSGGPPQTLCDVATARGGTWNRDGVILFSPGPTSPIYRVPAAGGAPVAVTKLGGAGEGHRFPEFLPDGNHFLYQTGAATADRAGIYLASLSGEPPVRILPDNSNAIFAPPAAGASEGHILFRRDDVLMAQAFDAPQLKKIGDVLPVAEQVALGMNAGVGVFSASGTGLLALRSADQAERQLVSVDRAGKRGAIIVAKGEEGFGSGGLSPDGRLLAEGLGTVSQRDIWIVDAARAASTRFSFRSGVTRNPVWSPDGSRIAYGFQNNAGYNYDIVVKPANGTGQEDLLLAAGVNTWPSDWSPDGKFLLIQQTGQNTAIDLALLPVDGPKPEVGSRKIIPFAQTPFDETEGRFSPDGKWIAYVSNESGGRQVYLQTYPTTGAKYQVSTAGGMNPRWRRDGKEIYFLSADGKVMAASIKLGSSVELGTPQTLFADVRMTNFIPTADGQHFFVNVPAGDENAAPMLTVIVNWQAGLKK